jgi:hypothetical protein
LVRKISQWKIDGALEELIRHPRFFPIFSRHGGLGSQEPYPHIDLKPWVERIVELSGYDHIMWGSECPVLYWRNETIPSCQNWLSDLLGSENLKGFLGENAQREIFDRTRTIPAFDYGGLELPMDVYEKLHRKYVEQLQNDATKTFAGFVIEVLKKAIR